MNRHGRQRVILAAGGTGGHMFPAQALARELIGRGVDVALMTDKRGAGFGPELPQVATYRISAGAITGGSLSRKLSGGLSLALGYLQSQRALKTLQPDCVVGFGGYASVPAMLAAARAGVRTILHEQNAVMGRANRLLAKRAQVIATSFEQVAAMDPAWPARIALTGNPVRPAIATLSRHPYPVPAESDRLRVLITGGSQGARAFNTIIPDALCRLPEHMRRRLDVSQQVRGPDTQAIQAQYQEAGITATLTGFFEDMPERLAATHLLVCRSGASTVAELTVSGRPAIFIPFPFAADDHQTANARAVAEAGGGWVMPQSTLTPEILAERLLSLLANPAALAFAARCTRALARDEAAQRLAALVCDAAGDNGTSGHDDKPERGEEAA